MTDRFQSRRPVGSHESATLPDWAIGPCLRDETPALEPTGDGWESGRIFNMSPLAANDRLLLYYRATPRADVDLDSRVGLAVSEDGETFRRYEHNPVLEPTAAYEQRGCEDPKVYEYSGTYYMFYHAVWESTGLWSGGDAAGDPDEELATENRADRSGLPGEVRCNICVATSPDLLHWEKQGQLVPASLSGGWAKGGVVPHDPQGRAVRIDGEFLMFVGEVDAPYQLLGRSEDLLHWEFERTTFLDAMPEAGVSTVHEPATALTDIPGREDDLVLTFNYDPTDDLAPTLQTARSHREAIPPLGQALYSTADPTSVCDFAPEPGGSWGGVIAHDGEWVFADPESAHLVRAPMKQ